jgi:uroporphyrinogen decarboxylase
MGAGAGAGAMNALTGAIAGVTQSTPPVWCMRQAGRYQRAYQSLRQQHSFEELCRDPELSARVALSSIEDFDFDAAILFSDLLFPLDVLGLGLSYGDHGPAMARKLSERSLERARPADELAADLKFQADAVRRTRQQLSPEKGLIGFVGGPWTLFVYAVEGSHLGSLATAKSSLPLYQRFARVIVPVLERVIAAQLEAGADLVMVFDTAAGELTPVDFQRRIVPDLTRLAASQPGRLGYFARGLHPSHLEGGSELPGGQWAGMGFDWRWNLADLLASSSRRGFVQGNFDPVSLQLEGDALRRALDDFLNPIAACPPERRRGWICGLGHGVLPGTSEASVRTFVQTVRRRLA